MLFRRNAKSTPKSEKYQRFLPVCVYFLLYVFCNTRSVAFYGWIARTFEQTHAKSISQCVDNVHKTIYSIVFFSSFVFTVLPSKLRMHSINVCGFCLFSLSLNEIGFVWKIYTDMYVCLFVYNTKNTDLYSNNQKNVAVTS